jgi:hypothetical protein
MQHLHEQATLHQQTGHRFQRRHVMASRTRRLDQNQQQQEPAPVPASFRCRPNAPGSLLLPFRLSPVSFCRIRREPGSPATGRESDRPAASFCMPKVACGVSRRFWRMPPANTTNLVARASKSVETPRESMCGRVNPQEAFTLERTGATESALQAGCNMAAIRGRYRRSPTARSCIATEPPEFRPRVVHTPNRLRTQRTARNSSRIFFSMRHTIHVADTRKR